MISKEMVIEALKRAIDNLNRFILVIWFIAFIVSLFIHDFIFDLIPILLLIIFGFRLFSKDKIARDKENNRYLKVRNFILKPFDILIKNIKDKDHVYAKCHKCKTILKLPLPDKRGFKHAKCPHCKARVGFWTMKQIKIEIIKKRATK